jgi:hypothetical protein
LVKLSSVERQGCVYIVFFALTYVYGENRGVKGLVGLVFAEPGDYLRLERTIKTEIACVYSHNVGR